MGISRQYMPIDPSKGGKTSAVILACAMFGSVLILAASVFIGVRLAEMSGDTPPTPPAPLPLPPVNVSITSKIQMSLLFLQAQKSGRLPDGYPITWRNDSGLADGEDQNRDLSGGFFVGGNNIKHNFPMAYTVTMLSWALIEYEGTFRMVNMNNEMAELIEWGVEYLLKTRFQDVIFAQVGTPDIEDVCWIRPEDMKAAQRPTAYPCDVNHPCSDLAGEYAAAFASASLAFRVGNPQYADFLLQNAKEVFKFADTYRGKYSDWVTGAQQDFNSTGYGDELMWGAAWLYFASGDNYYLDYLIGPNSYLFGTNVWTDETKVFSWDLKSPGVQILMSRLLLLGYGIGNDGQIPQFLETYLNAAKLYVCQYTRTWTGSNFTDSKELIFGGYDHSLEHVVNSGFLGVLLSDYLRVSVTANLSSHYLDCDSTLDDIVIDAGKQAEYILGKNPLNMSYMVGYSENYPTRVHHKGASIPSKRVDFSVYDCSSGRKFLMNPGPNPNVLVGALVGGPAQDDSYQNSRINKFQSEPRLYINAVWTGLLAALGSPVRPGNSLTRMWVQIPFAKKYASLLEEFVPKLSPPPAGPPPPWSAPSPPPPISPPIGPPPYKSPPPPPPPSPSPPPPNPPTKKIPPPKAFLKAPALKFKSPPPPSKATVTGKKVHPPPPAKR